MLRKLCEISNFDYTVRISVNTITGLFLVYRALLYLTFVYWVICLSCRVTAFCSLHREFHCGPSAQGPLCCVGALGWGRGPGLHPAAEVMRVSLRAWIQRGFCTLVVTSLMLITASIYFSIRSMIWES